MADNPRIEDLRKRIEKDPGSRLFAQLAEELRKDGELEDAIRVAREGLRQHPNYPSARMTLGRALLDTGDWAAAKTEFESVLKGAPDNILAGRYLAECLENLGDRDGALARYKATLAMAPGEKHVVAKIQELEKGGARASAAPPLAPGLRPPSTGAFVRPAVTAAGVRPAAPAPPAGPPTAPGPPPPPLPVADVEGDRELEAKGDAGPGASPGPPPAPPAEDPAPIPLVEADEEFELERPYESPATGIGASAPPRPVPPPAPAAKPAPPAAAAPPTPPAPAAPPAPADEPEFELEAPYEAPSTRWTPSIPPLPPEPEPAPRAEPAASEPTASPEPMAPAAPLVSATLGELYFNQGFADKAIEVYRQLSAREPGNDRLRARLRELEASRPGPEPAAAAPAAPAPPVSAPPPPAPAPVAAAGSDPAGERRQAIERTIGRLEDLLSAIRKG